MNKSKFRISFIGVFCIFLLISLVSILSAEEFTDANLKYIFRGTDSGAYHEFKTGTYLEENRALSQSLGCASTDPDVSCDLKGFHIGISTEHAIGNNIVYVGRSFCADSYVTKVTFIGHKRGEIKLERGLTLPEPIPGFHTHIGSAGYLKILDVDEDNNIMFFSNPITIPKTDITLFEKDLIKTGEWSTNEDFTKTIWAATEPGKKYGAVVVALTDLMLQKTLNSNGYAESEISYSKIIVEAKGCGVDKQASSDLCGKKGCDIANKNSYARLVVPPNALEGSGEIVTTNGAFPGTVITLAKEDPSFYGGNIIAIYELTPEELTFAIPASLTIEYNESLVQNEDSLDIYLYDYESDNWIALNAEIDKNINRLTAQIGHLGIYAVIAQLDNAPPVTTLTIGEPKYEDENIFITSETELTLEATDYPVESASGVKATYYCTDQTNECEPTNEYLTSITIAEEGTNYLRYYSEDNIGNKEETKSTKLIVDNTPPELSLAPNPYIIWSPNKKEVDVKVDGSASDALSGVKTNEFKLVDEYNEVTAIVNDFGDIVKLIAWRDGNDKDGRKYDITITSSDNLGNTAITGATVIVPHDQRK